MDVTEAREIIWEYYRQHGRQMPWREPELDGTFDAYKILVSEVMLQQTQVSRVVPKYQSFVAHFPTIQDLSEAPLSAVLNEWSGLGYNRRARYLHEAAKQLAGRPQPWGIEALTACKGIGRNTAAAVLTYTYNRPIMFIETNVRTVFIHHFFPAADVVSDGELMPFVERALDHEHPREWHWALMDYGAHLKTTQGNMSRASKHYAKQSAFHGSQRQIRGQVLRLLQDQGLTLAQLAGHITDSRLVAVTKDLTSEGLITKTNKTFHLG